MNRAIERELEEHGYGLFQIAGDSMEPLLHNRQSTVLIEKQNRILKKYDVVLFRRPSGKYVLHRILAVRRFDCLICGDNRIYLEKVPMEWIIGIMTGYFPDESNCYISCDSLQYRKQSGFAGIRYCIRWIKALPMRIGRKICGKKQ